MLCKQMQFEMLKTFSEEVYVEMLFVYVEIQLTAGVANTFFWNLQTVETAGFSICQTGSEDHGQFKSYVFIKTTDTL